MRRLRGIQRIEKGEEDAQVRPGIRSAGYKEKGVVQEVMAWMMSMGKKGEEEGERE